MSKVRIVNLPAGLASDIYQHYDALIDQTMNKYETAKAEARVEDADYQDYLLNKYRNTRYRLSNAINASYAFNARYDLNRFDNEDDSHTPARD